MLELDKIHCGDNCDLLGQLPRECIDLVVTSPPYDDLRTYGGHRWDFFGVACQLKRVLKPGGVIVWVVADATKDGSETGSSMEQALHFKRLGLSLHDTMIYEKSGSSFPSHNRYLSCWEYMFVFSKGCPKSFNEILVPKTGNPSYSTGTAQRGTKKTVNPKYSSRKERRSGNVWLIANHSKNASSFDDAYKHPAIFPERLANDHIFTWSNPGDLVLDPFSGSGTTAKAAKELGRRFLGLEIDPEYCAIAERRIAQAGAGTQG